MTTPVQPHVGGDIIVGVDASAGSRDALRWAGVQAELTGAALVAVAAWHVPLSAYEAPAPMPGGYDLGPEVARMLDTTIRGVLGDDPVIKVTQVVVNGHPAPALIDAALGADLLVVGSRGHGQFVGMLLGSVAQHCVAHAACSVVVVRSGHPGGGEDRSVDRPGRGEG